MPTVGWLVFLREMILRFLLDTVASLSLPGKPSLSVNLQHLGKTPRGLCLPVFSGSSDEYIERKREREGKYISDLINCSMQTFSLMAFECMHFHIMHWIQDWMLFLLMHYKKDISKIIEMSCWIQCVIYIYAFSRRFYPKRLTFRLYMFCLCSLGIEPTIFCNALSHRNRG